MRARQVDKKVRRTPRDYSVDLRGLQPDITIIVPAVDKNTGEPIECHGSPALQAQPAEESQAYWEERLRREGLSMSAGTHHGVILCGTTMQAEEIVMHELIQKTKGNTRKADVQV